MKLQLLQQLVNRDQAFENVVVGLERIEKTSFFRADLVRYARAEVETARVEANREFFERFGEIVEHDARWAYKFRREHDRKCQDPFDFYLEIQEREEARTRKGLPCRAVLLPGWDKDDEDRDQREQGKKQAPNRHGKAANKPAPTREGSERCAAPRYSNVAEEGQPMTKRKSSAKLERPGKRYSGVRGKIVDWAEHVSEEGMLYVRVRFTDQTELCWVLQTAQVILRAELGDWKTGDFTQRALFVQNESGLP